MCNFRKDLKELHRETAAPRAKVFEVVWFVYLWYVFMVFLWFLWFFLWFTCGLFSITLLVLVAGLWFVRFFVCVGVFVLKDLFSSSTLFELLG